MGNLPSTSLDALTAQALALPEEQRFQLAERLWISVGGRWNEDEELFAEIARRDAEMNSPGAQTFSHEEVVRNAGDGSESQPQRGGRK